MKYVRGLAGVSSKRTSKKLPKVGHPVVVGGLKVNKVSSLLG